MVFDQSEYSFDHMQRSLTLTTKHSNNEAEVQERCNLSTDLLFNAFQTHWWLNPLTREFALYSRPAFKSVQ